MEWNAESDRVLRRMHTWYHLSSYEKFWVCGVVSLGYYQEGDGLRGLEHFFHELTAGIYSYFTPLKLGNTAIKCWGVTYKLDHAEI